MRLGGPKAGWMVTVGRDWWSDALFSISIGIGLIENRHEGDIPWRYYWRWSSASLPSIIFRQFHWQGRVLTLPIGYSAFGRSRIFWRC